MKKTANLFEIVALLLILFSVAACETSLGNDIAESKPVPVSVPVTASPYLGITTMVVTDQQVYELNHTPGGISTMHSPYKGPDLTIDALALSGSHLVGNGEITNGKLSIAVPPLSSTVLAKGEDLLGGFGEWSKAGAVVKILSPINEDLKDEKIGNAVVLASVVSAPPGFDKILMKWGFSGTRTSLSAEEMVYYYVDRDCKIIASEGVDLSLNYIYPAFTLELKKGWNVVCLIETYTTSGISTYSAELKNPNHAWVLLQPPS